MLLRAGDDPSVREIACDDGMVVTSADRGVTMRVTSVVPFASEVEAWHALGTYLMRESDATWSHERVLLYFSRFYRSDRLRPTVVVVGLAADSGLARVPGGEAI